MYKLCGKCRFHTDKCKNPDNPNYNVFKDDYDTCSKNKKPYDHNNIDKKNREQKAYFKNIK